MESNEFGLDDLTHFPLFEGLETSDLEALLPCLDGYIRAYPRNSFLILDEDSVPYVGMLLSGMVFMLKEDENGHQSFLNYMLPGELFGESFSLRKKKTPSHVSFLAARNSTALFLPLGKIMRSCEHHCRFHRVMNENLYELLAKKNAHLMQTLDILSKDTLRDKILSYLLLQPDEVPIPNGARQGADTARSVHIPLNKSELAHYLNVNRTSLCRELAAMEKDGLLTVSGNRYTLSAS
ncbi:Crp/Fnr family transcriptional regulator [Stomatobaculum sp.]|jgi:putative cyclic nucleotide-binding domain protein